MASSKPLVFRIAVALALSAEGLAEGQPTANTGTSVVQQAAPIAVAGGVLHLALPPDVSPVDLRMGSEAAVAGLHTLAREYLAALPPIAGQSDLDRIVVFVDRNGQAILPDLEAARDAWRNRDVASGTHTALANELAFTFVSPSYPWSAEELSTLNLNLSEFYPLAKAIYGNPAFNITVNVRKDPTISYAGLYYPSLNELVLRNAVTPDALCHEMIHAFRDDNLIGLSTYEEGMTRAAEVEVFNQLPGYSHWDESHSYSYDVYYEALNTPVIGAPGGNIFAGYPGALLRYQLSGYAWAKPMLENPAFFGAFNAELYLRTLADPSTPYQEAKLIPVAAGAQAIVEGMPFATWYANQGVLNTHPPTGYLLYQRINQFTIDYLYRDVSGWESSLGSATIVWSVRDHEDVLMDSGSGVTSFGGWINVNPEIPGDYTGRSTFVAQTSTPTGNVMDTTFWPVTTRDGVFGVVKDFDAGTVTITPLDEPVGPSVVNVIDGAFFATALAEKRGRFLAEFSDSAGHSISRRFNKDAADYFLQLALVPSDEVSLTVTVAGDGEGTIASVPAGIACPDTCDYVYPRDTVVELTATAAAGSTFVGWSGLCVGSGTCVITMTSATSVTATFARTGRDLVETEVIGPTEILGPGAVFNVSDTVENQGGTDAGSSVTRYYLSLDSVKGGGDKRLSGARALPELPAGGLSAGNATVKVPTSTLVGIYWLLACADDTKVVPEADEQNNCTPAPSRVTVALPDLIEDAVSSPPASGVPGTKMTVSDLVRNAGTATAAASTTRYYLSIDAVMNAGDVLTGTRSVPSLAPGLTSVGNVSVTIATTGVGTYHLLACADGNLKVKETNEGNNCAAAPGTVLIGWPDLVTTAVSDPPATAQPGGKFTVTDTVANQGNVAAAASTTKYYLSVDAIRHVGDAALGGGRSVLALDPGAAASGSKKVGISLATPAGTYHVLACADDTAKVAESDNTNNCRASSGTVVIQP